MEGLSRTGKFSGVTFEARAGEVVGIAGLAGAGRTELVETIFGVRKVFPRETDAERLGEPFTPTPELCEIVRRCGQAFGVDLYGVDIIESDGKPYVVDMNSIPGFKSVPDAPQRLARYFYAAAERAAQGRPLVEPAAATEAVTSTLPFVSGPRRSAMTS